MSLLNKLLSKLRSTLAMKVANGLLGKELRELGFVLDRYFNVDEFKKNLCIKIASGSELMDALLIRKVDNPQPDGYCCGKPTVSVIPCMLDNTKLKWHPIHESRIHTKFIFDAACLVKDIKINTLDEHPEIINEFAQRFTHSFHGVLIDELVSVGKCAEVGHCVNKIILVSSEKYHEMIYSGQLDKLKELYNLIYVNSHIGAMSKYPNINTIVFNTCDIDSAMGISNLDVIPVLPDCFGGGVRARLVFGINIDGDVILA